MSLEIQPNIVDINPLPVLSEKQNASAPIKSKTVVIYHAPKIEKPKSFLYPNPNEWIEACLDFDRGNDREEY